MDGDRHIKDGEPKCPVLSRAKVLGQPRVQLGKSMRSPSLAPVPFQSSGPQHEQGQVCTLGSAEEQERRAKDGGDKGE